MQQINLGRLGGQLGMLFCLIGFVVMFLGWNGAASYNYISQQFPYVLSGGVIGLGIVVIGAAMIIVQNARADRARLEAAIDRLSAAVEKQGLGGPGARGAGMAGFVVAGGASYHRLDCALSAERDEAELIGIDEAIDRDLEPCRVCSPPRIARPARHG